MNKLIITIYFVLCSVFVALGAVPEGKKDSELPTKTTVNLTDRLRAISPDGSGAYSNSTISIQTIYNGLTNVPGLGTSTNGFSKPRWQYYDDFNVPLVAPGVFPDSPSGHRYRVISSGSTNGVEIRDGLWGMTTAGAIYLSVSNNNAGAVGSDQKYNQFGGIFRFDFSSNGTFDGVQRDVHLILSSNHDFAGFSPLWLHCTIGSSGFSIHRELSATNFISENYSGGANLTYNTNYNFTLTIISNTIVAEVAGYRFMRTDPLIGLYTNMTVVTYETTGVPTNQIYGRWDACYAGYAETTYASLYGASGIIPGRTNFSLAGFKLEEETTTRMAGTTNLTAGIVTVPSSIVSAKTRFSIQAVATANAVSALCVTNIVNGTSFQIRSASGADANRVDYLLWLAP